MRSFLILLASIFCVSMSLPQRSPSSEVQEPLYLPNGNALEILSFGFRNALSDYLWMQTLSDFGKHFRSDKQYKWFGHQCGLVVRLNPKSFEPFYLCSSLLAFEANDPDAAIKLLDQAVTEHPESWLFFYYRGFYRMHFHHDHRGAKNDFIEASKRPDAHPIAARLASKSMSELDSPESAIQFLRAAIKATSNENAKSALQSRLNEIIYDADLTRIEKALIQFPSATTIGELVTANAYRGPLTDPYGGNYIIENGAVKSTSGHKRLSEYRGLVRNP